MEKFRELLTKSKFSGESIDRALFEITINSNLDLDELNSFSESQKDHFALELRSDDGERYNLPCIQSCLLDQPLLLQIVKHNTHDSCVFFSDEGFANALKSKEIQDKTMIYINSDFHEFSSRRCKFKSWIGIYEPYDTNQVLVDPRKFIKDSSGGELTENLEFWITHQQPLVESDTFKLWLNVALGKTSLIFCSEIWSDQKSLKLIFTGTQTLEMIFTPEIDGCNLLTNNIKISEAAGWILEVDREVEIRHSLLSSRIANEQLRKEDTWPALIGRALSKTLENAKNDYRAHLHSKSSETLKVIADIRKSIAEESSKIIERTHALSSVLFRDIAIAFGTISVKFLAAKNKDDFKTEIMFLLLFTACWLAASLYMTTSTNRLYIFSLARSRYFWGRKVNQSIPISEFKELSERPFRDAVRAYDKTRQQATLIYTLVIIALISVSISHLSIIRQVYDLLISVKAGNFSFDFSHYKNMP